LFKIWEVRIKEVRPAFVTETLQFETKYCSQAIAFYSFEVQSHGSSVDDILIYKYQPSFFFSFSKKYRWTQLLPVTGNTGTNTVRDIELELRMVTWTQLNRYGRRDLDEAILRRR
jgi:hypothetical protein